MSEGRQRIVICSRMEIKKLTKFRLVPLLIFDHSGNLGDKGPFGHIEINIIFAGT